MFGARGEKFDSWLGRGGGGESWAEAVVEGRTGSSRRRRSAPAARARARAPPAAGIWAA